jgi:ABC-type methionine transport system permease subunit
LKVKIDLIATGPAAMRPATMIVVTFVGTDGMSGRIEAGGF